MNEYQSQLFTFFIHLKQLTFAYSYCSSRYISAYLDDSNNKLLPKLVLLFVSGSYPANEMAHTTNPTSLAETDDHSLRDDYKILRAHHFKDGYSNVPK